VALDAAGVFGCLWLQHFFVYKKMVMSEADLVLRYDDGYGYYFVMVR
jgi:hypothetical protein